MATKEEKAAVKAAKEEKVVMTAPEIRARTKEVSEQAVIRAEEMDKERARIEADVRARTEAEVRSRIEPAEWAKTEAGIQAKIDAEVNAIIKTDEEARHRKEMEIAARAQAELARKEAEAPRTDVESPKDTASVYGAGGQLARSYTLESHGKDYRSLADGYAKKLGGTVR